MRCACCGENKDPSEFGRQGDRLRSACKPCHAARAKVYRAANPEKSRATTRKWNEANKDWVKQRNRLWFDRNRERIMALRRVTDARKRADPIHNVAQRVRRRLHHGLRNGRESMTTQEMLGYTFRELKQHLERQFLKGMTWSNMGEWHIDHIIPLCAFKYSGPSDMDFKRAWCLTNLRPLWATDNLAKNDKIICLL